MRITPFAAVMLLFLSASVFAQTAATGSLNVIAPSVPRQQVDFFDGHHNEFGFWGGFSPNSSSLIGVSVDRSLSLFAARYGRLIHAGDHITWKYTADFVPLAIVHQPVNHGPWEDRSHRESRYGAGIAPIGFQANFRPHQRIQPFLETAEGFLYFNRPTPYADATNFNFTFDLGAGIQTFAPRHRSVSFGYKYHHISNAYTGRVNPGLDSNLFYVAYSLFK